MSLNQRRAARTGISLLLLFTLPVAVQGEDFTYTTNNGTITITGYTGPGGAVTIPDTINGLPVTSITDSAFGFCTSLAGVTIPRSVTSIGVNPYLGAVNPFVGCTNLTAITVNPENTHYTSMAGVLFSNGPAALVAYPGGKAGSYVIPDGVTRIGGAAFSRCIGLTSVTIPDSVTNLADSAFNECGNLTSVSTGNSVTSIGHMAFYRCTKLTNVVIGNSVTSLGYGSFRACFSLTNVTIPNSVTRIGEEAFAACIGLISITIPNSVSNLGIAAFVDCRSLVAVYFNGNAPSLSGSYVFSGDSNTTVFYMPGTTGWGPTFGGRPTILWDPPAIQTSPQTQTAEAGTVVGFRVEASGALPLFYLGFLNDTNLISYSTNCELEVGNVQFAHSGNYTMVISNAFGAVTSAPAMLNVIAPIERRPVPGVEVTGEAGSLLNVDYADTLGPAPIWTTLNSVLLTTTSQYCFDLSAPPPPQRFYRAWQTTIPPNPPLLCLNMVPAITLIGSPGDQMRVDGINAIGPTDAWFTLDDVTLTNSSQLYFDVSSVGQPRRLYRLTLLP